MFATLFLSVICSAPICYEPAASYQSDGTRTDPVSVIRAMVDRGEYTDAAEALDGLPETIRHREAAYLYFQARDLARTRESGMKHLAIDRNDVELLRILGDSAAMERRLDESEKLYQEAKGKLTTDPRLTDAMQDSELSALEYRFKYIQNERGRLASVKGAEDRVRIGVYLSAGALGLVFVISLLVATVAQPPKGKS